MKKRNKIGIDGWLQHESKPGRGFDENIFSGIPENWRWHLLVFMAQISEASYRRGIRQCLAIARKCDNADALFEDERMERFQQVPAHLSPCILTQGGVPAIYMLWLQYSIELDLVGLNHPQLSQELAPCGRESCRAAVEAEQNRDSNDTVSH
ncbi:MAG: hypothetical protein ACO3IT_09360 [Ilumatobacteraceae bacterium]